MPKWHFKIQNVRWYFTNDKCQNDKEQKYNVKNPLLTHSYQVSIL